MVASPASIRLQNNSVPVLFSSDHTPCCPWGKNQAFKRVSRKAIPDPSLASSLQAAFFQNPVAINQHTAFF